MDRFNQWLTVDSNGTVHVVFYDTRNSTNRTGVDLYYTFSTDGAQTWNTPERISSQTSANLTDGQEWGDYNGIAVMMEKVIPTWTDNRDGPPNMKDVYVADVLNVTAAPSFTLSGDLLTQAVCRPGDLADITVDVGQILGFTNPVTLSLNNLPSGMTGSFSVNPVTPPGQTIVSISVDGTVPEGQYEVMIVGTATGANDRQINVNIDVQTGVFAGPTLVSPPDGEPFAGANLVTLSWDEVPGATGYRVQVSETSNFIAPFIDSPTSETSFQVMSLTLGDEYFWRVATGNTCGEGAFSAAFSFTANAQRILLVDQDDNDPELRSFFTDTLDALGESYLVFDANSDTPLSTEMANHEVVIWFSGDRFSGPTDDDGLELATYIDGGGKLFLSSQDYLWPFRPDVPTFGQSYLGIGSVINDGGNYGSVSPVAGGIFDGLPTMNLTYGDISDFSDNVTPNAMGTLALTGDNGNGAAIVTDNTVFFAFPFPAIANNGTRVTSTDAENLLAAILAHLGVEAPCVVYETSLLDLWLADNGFGAGIDNNGNGIIDMGDYVQLVNNIGLCE